MPYAQGPLTARDLRTEVYWACRGALRSTRRRVGMLMTLVRASPRERRRLIASYRFRLIQRQRNMELRLHTSPFSDGSRVRFGDDRTAYLNSLWGAGRQYVMDLTLRNIGNRAAHVRNGIGLYQGPTSMIHFGHSTIKYVSRAHLPPAITNRLLELVRLGFADLIFIYRHPIDSLLTNWICWRNVIRDNSLVVISDAYRSTDDLCAALDQNFSELKALAEGDPDFLAAISNGRRFSLPKHFNISGRRFMSLPEFVEETTLFARCSTLALRLEDFAIDPAKEFSKIVEVMSADVDVSRLLLEPPITQPYRYLEVKQKVPQFQKAHRRVGRRDEKTDRANRLFCMTELEVAGECPQGRVFWITGLSGAGKTTVGRELWGRLRVAGRSGHFPRWRRASRRDRRRSWPRRRQSAAIGDAQCAPVPAAGRAGH